MDEVRRKEFLARIKRDVSSLTGNDRDFVQHVIGMVLKRTADPRMGPVTLLTPSEEALDRLGLNDDEIAPELRDPLLGLFLDQVILGKLPAREAVGNRSTPTVFSTLGGASATLTVDEDALVLTDTCGRSVRISEPVMDGPKVAWRMSDDLLMWDEWNWL
jgi:hypothetical protein